jgi:hypothetical protein
LIETETPREEGEPVSGTAAVRRGSVAKMNAGEKYMSVRALKVLGAY